MRFETSLDSASPSTGLFERLGSIAWWAAKQLTRALAFQNTFNFPAAPSHNYQARSLVAAAGDYGVMPPVNASIFAETDFSNDLSKAHSRALRGSERLTASCSITFTFPANPAYTENADYSFPIGVTLVPNAGCSYPVPTITLSVPVGQLSYSGSTGAVISFTGVGGGGVTNYYTVTFTPPSYYFQAVNVYVAASNLGASGNSIMVLPGTAVRIPLQSIASTTLSTTRVNVGTNSVQLPITSSVLNYNGYTLQVVVGSSFGSWIAVLNTQTGLINVVSVPGQQGAYSVPITVSDANDATNFVDFTLPLTVLDIAPAINSILIPNIPYGTPLNQSLALPPSANSVISDADGVTDICPTGTPPCRISLANAPSWWSLNNRTGALFGWPPTAPISGSSILYAGQVVVSDLAGGSASAQVTFQVVSSLQFSSTNVTQITQGQTTALTGVSLSTPGVGSVSINMATSYGTLVVTPQSGATVVPSSGQSTFGSLVISGSNINAVLATLKHIAAASNRNPVAISLIATDSLGQQTTASATLAVTPMNHPLSATSITPTVSSTVPTQATSVIVSSANLNNIDSVLWTVTGVNITSTTGTIIASNTSPNGWIFSGLNGVPTSQQAQIIAIPPAGSQASYGMSLAIQPVDGTSTPLAGMPVLNLATPTFAVSSAPISVPPASLANIQVGVNSSLTLPAASTTGDSLIDQITNLPVGWSYSNGVVTANAANAGSVTLIRKVCATHDASQCTIQTYTSVAVASLSATNTGVTQLLQGSSVSLVGLSVSSPAPSLTYTLRLSDATAASFSANTTTAGVGVSISGGQLTLSGAPAAINNYLSNTPPILTGSVTNRSPLSLSLSVVDSLGQSTSSSEQITVNPVNHPLQTSSIAVSVPVIQPTQTTPILVSSSNLVNTDNVLWQVTQVNVTRNGTLIATSVAPNGWGFSGLNGAPTNQQAQISVTAPAGSQGIYSVSLGIQAVDNSGVALSGMPPLSLNTGNLAVTSAAITVPPAVLSTIFVGQNTQFNLPPATTVGDSLVDQITNLPSGWTYNSSTCVITANAANAGSITLIREVSDAHDASQRVVQTYSLVSAASLSASGASISSLNQGSAIALTGLSVTTPASSVTYTVSVGDATAASFSANRTTPGVTVVSVSGQMSFSGSPAALNNYFLMTPPQLIGSLTNRLPISLSVNVQDSLGQTSSASQQFAVMPVNHPLTSTSIIPSVSNTLSTQPTYVTLASANLANVDGVLWKIVSVNVTANSALIASDAHPNGWSFSGLNGVPTNQQAQIIMIPPAGSQASYSASLGVQAVDSLGNALPGMPLLDLPTSAFSITSSAIQVPAATLPIVALGQNKTVVLPAASTVGDTLVDTISNLPSGWSYNSATQVLTMKPAVSGNTGTVILTRVVCAAHDTAQCTTQTYSVQVVPTMVVSSTVNAQLAYIGRAFGFNLPSATSPVGYNIRVSLEDTSGNPAPAWLQPNPNTGVVSSRVPADAAQIYNLVPVYTDQTANQLRLSPFSFGTQVALQVQMGRADAYAENEADVYLPSISYSYPGNTAANVLVAISPAQAASFGVIETNGSAIVPLISSRSATGSAEWRLNNITQALGNFLAAKIPLILAPNYFGTIQLQVSVDNGIDPATPSIQILNVLHVNQPTLVQAPLPNVTRVQSDSPTVVSVVASLVFANSDLTANVGYRFVRLADNTTLPVPGVWSSIGSTTGSYTIGSSVPSGVYEFNPCVIDSYQEWACDPFIVTVLPTPAPSVYQDIYAEFQKYGPHVGTALAVAPIAYRLLRLVLFLIRREIKQRQSAALLELTIAFRNNLKREPEHVLHGLREITIGALTLLLRLYQAQGNQDRLSVVSGFETDDTRSEVSDLSDRSELSSPGELAAVSGISAHRRQISSMSATEKYRIGKESKLAQKRLKIESKLEPLLNSELSEDLLKEYASFTLKFLLKILMASIHKDATVKRRVSVGFGRPLSSARSSEMRSIAMDLDAFQAKVDYFDALVAALTFFDPEGGNIPYGFEADIEKAIEDVGCKIRSALEDGDTDRETQGWARLYLALVQYLFYIKTYQHRPIQVDRQLNMINDLFASPGVRVRWVRKLCANLYYAFCCATKPEALLPVDLKLDLKTAVAVLSRFANDDSLIKTIVRVFCLKFQLGRTIFTPVAAVWEDEIERLRFMSVVAAYDQAILLKILREYLTTSDDNPHLIRSYQERLKFLVAQIEAELVRIDEKMTSFRGDIRASTAGVPLSPAMTAIMDAHAALQKSLSLISAATNIRKRSFFIMTGTLEQKRKATSVDLSDFVRNGFTNDRACLKRLIDEFSYKMASGRLVDAERRSVKELFVSALIRIAKEHKSRKIRVMAIEGLKRHEVPIEYSCSETMSIVFSNFCGTSRREHKKVKKTAAALFFSLPSPHKSRASSTPAAANDAEVVSIGQINPMVGVLSARAAAPAAPKKVRTTFFASDDAILAGAGTGVGRSVAVAPLAIRRDPGKRATIFTAPPVLRESEGPAALVSNPMRAAGVPGYIPGSPL